MTCQETAAQNVNSQGRRGLDSEPELQGPPWQLGGTVGPQEDPLSPAPQAGPHGRGADSRARAGWASVGTSAGYKERRQLTHAV